METITTLEPKTISSLQNLIRINIDSAKGFDKAAQQIEHTPTAQLFKSIAGERRAFAEELRRYVRMNDEEAADSGSIKGQIHRWWINIVGTVRDGDQHAILAEAERGEDAIKHAYEDTLPPIAGNPLNRVLQDQYARVKQAHDRIRDLRDATR
ncbi:MAG: PA2169 family four-helix-bundle protein [Phycisphaerales bacterium]